MKINFNNSSFTGKYVHYGPKTTAKTAEAFNKVINQYTTNAKIATQAQDYLGTPKMQEKISKLPENSFVRYYTSVLEKSNGQNEFLSKPSLVFDTADKKMTAFKLKYPDKNCLDLSLDDEGKLNKKEINNWFDLLLGFFSK